MSRAQVFDATSQPLRNITEDPFPSSTMFGWTVSNRGTGGAGTTTYDATDQALVDTTTTAASNTTWTFRVGTNGTTGSVPTIPNWYVWQTVQVKSSILDARAYTIDYFTSGGVAVNHDEDSALFNVRTSLPAGQWVDLVFYGRVPATAAQCNLHVVWTGTVGTGNNAAKNRTVGATMKVRRGVALLSPHPIPEWMKGVYRDGDSPGWQWVGAVNTRTRYSIGWPL